MIDSAENLKSIVGTMKAYASSNIVQFQTAAKASMEYNEIINMSLYIVLKDQQEKKSSQNKEEYGSLYIVFGSDHGLAGRFNENISLFAEDILKKDYNEKNKLLVIGQQIYSRLYDRKELAGSYLAPQSVESIIESVLDILLKIEEYRENTKKIILIYICRESTVPLRKKVKYYIQ
jgi:F-type H+-transporting ATPase subunit gamma